MRGIVAALLLAITMSSTHALTVIRTVTITIPVSVIITVTPQIIWITDAIIKGSMVAQYSVVNRDGTPFTGTVNFGLPYMDNGGIFAMTGGAIGNIIVNPSGPGVPLVARPTMERITIEAR